MVTLLKSVPTPSKENLADKTKLKMALEGNEGDPTVSLKSQMWKIL